MKIKISALLIILFISVNLCAQINRADAPKPGPAPKIQLENPKTFELENGIEVFVVENHKLPRVSFTLLIDNDPIVEGKNAGVSGILSSVLGNGTTSISKEKFIEEVDYLGINLNFGSESAFASGLSKYSDRILELMADGVMHPLITEEEFQKEKNRAIDGIKVNEKSVANIANRVGAALSYGINHPYGEFVTEETLNNISFEDLKSFYNTKFNPNNAYLVVIGDVDFIEIKNKIEDTFGKWNPKATQEIIVPEPRGNIDATEIDFVDMPNAVQTNIIITNNVKLKMNDDDYFAALIANFILGGGGTGYLFENLREDKGYTYGSYSRIDASRYHASRFLATAEVRNEVTDSSIVEMLREVKRLQNETVSNETLENAKAQYSGAFVMALERPETVASFALNIKTKNLPEDYYTTYLEKINAVTADDVKRVANKYFKPENARIIVVSKGSDVLENLEKTGIPIKYFDKYANPVEKPVFSKPIPEGVSAQTVLNNYLEAIGGKQKAETVKTILTTAEVKIQGAPFEPKAEIKQMFPNKESLEMSVEGYGVIMKQKFNGETGYTEQQGQRTVLTDKDLKERKSDYTIFPELHYDLKNVSLVSIVSINDNDVYKIKVSNGENDTYRYYDINTGLLSRTESTSYPVNSSEDERNQAITQIADFEDYQLVNDILFPHSQTYKSGPQSFNFNILSISINEDVTDTDFD